MPRIISPEEYQQRIEQLCEGTKYSFVRFKEWKGSRTKLVMRCSEHGEWGSTNVKDFTRGRRCPKCASNAALTPEEYQQRIEQLCEGTKYSFVRFKEWKGNRTKVVMKCSEHGEWGSTNISYLLLGRRCPKCTSNPALTPEEYQQRIEQLCEGTKYSFVRFKEWKGCHTKLVMRCSEHGEWGSTSISNFTQGQRCPKCAKNISPEEYQQRIEQLCEGTKYLFVRFKEWKGCHTKLVMRCSEHGEWGSTDIQKFTQGSRCPKCAVTGYNPLKPGVLYALRAIEYDYIKIGITNNINQRIIQLRRSTPFEFNVIEQIYGDGEKIAKLEKDFHNVYESAGLTGFNGCTEWLKYDDGIRFMLRLLVS